MTYLQCLINYTMSKIYTRGGDGGFTSVYGGDRVSKTHLRIEALGTLDELNVAIGTARSFMAGDDTLQPLLKEVQLTLMTLMSIVAAPAAKRADNPLRFPADAADRIEEAIDTMSDSISSPGWFILPGGNHAAAFLHQARVTARRAERCLWRLAADDDVPEPITRYINRLSDLLFVAARYEMSRDDYDDERWRLFRVRRSTPGCPNCP